MSLKDLTKIGFNYGHQTPTYDYAQVDKDFEVLKNLGINRLGIAMGGYAADGSYSTQVLAKYAKSKGFYVGWGITGPACGKETDWTGRNAQYIGAAQWAQANGIDLFYMGNEREINGTPIVSASQTGGVATIVTTFQHGLTVGQAISLRGLSTGYTGDTTVLSVISTTSFTCTVSAGAVDPSVIFSSAQLMCRSSTTIVSDLVSSAAVVKPYFSGPICYRTSGGGAAVSAWLNSPAANNGRGDLDIIGLNQYDSDSIFFTNISNFVNRYGKDHFMLSEWNTHSGIVGNISGSLVNGDDRVWQTYIERRLGWIQNMGFEAYLFAFRDGGFGVETDTWAMMLADRSTRQTMQLFSKNRRYLF